MPKPMDAACIIRASCPPPMIPTLTVCPRLTRRSVPVTMTGSLRRLQELAAVLRAELTPVRERRSLQLEDHRALHNEIDGGSDPLRNHERNDLNRKPTQAVRGEQREQHAK
jgi:hypothetical protein